MWPPSARVLGGVVEQVRQDLREAHRVAVQPRAARPAARRCSACRRAVDQRRAGLDGVAHDRRRGPRAPCAARSAPRLMREISSRSSTSRTRWLTWRSIMSWTRATAASAPPVARSRYERVAQRRERVAQLVRERREELVLRAVGFVQLRSPAPGSPARPAGARSRRAWCPATATTSPRGTEHRHEDVVVDAAAVRAGERDLAADRLRAWRPPARSRGRAWRRATARSRARGTCLPSASSRVRPHIASSASFA